MLINKINEDFKSAFKARKMEEKDFLGVLKVEVTKETKEPSDDKVVATIQSMIKNGKKSDSITSDEMEILERYLPQMMSDSDLEGRIGIYISAEKISGMQNMGKVMGWLKENYSGQYDGKKASDLVKKSLI
jgi:uncharacterized protein YqeY